MNIPSRHFAVMIVLRSARVPQEIMLDTAMPHMINIVIIRSLIRITTINISLNVQSRHFGANTLLRSAKVPQEIILDTAMPHMIKIVIIHSISPSISISILSNASAREKMSTEIRSSSEPLTGNFRSTLKRINNDVGTNKQKQQIQQQRNAFFPFIFTPLYAKRRP